jgi:phosphate transport system permease protein
VRRFFEKFIEALIKTSGYTTSIIVLLIVVFLFKEGISFLGESPVEHSYTLIGHRDNPVNELKDLDIKNIFDGKINNWKEIGGIHLWRGSFRQGS